MRISRIEFVLTWLTARLYISLATVAAVGATVIIYVGDKLNKRGQSLAMYLKEVVDEAGRSK